MSGKCCCPLKSLFECHLNETFIQRVQEVILWKRPIVLAITLLVTNIIFITEYRLQLGFLATIFFLGFIHSMLKVIQNIAGPVLEKILFPTLQEDDQSASNHVRPYSEVKEYLNKITKLNEQLDEWLKKFVQAPTPMNYLLFFGTMFLLFITFNIFGSFWFLYIFIHSGLLIPGLVLNPTIRNFVNHKIEEAKQEANKHKNE